MKPTVTVLSLLLLTTCTNPDVESRKFNYQIDSLSYVLNSRDSVINDMLTAFNEIERNLDTVSAKQHLVSMHIRGGGVELSTSHKELINTQINTINKLISQNRRRIDELGAKLRHSTARIVEFQRMIQTLNTEIQQKNRESLQLNEQLNDLSIHVIELQASIDTLTKQNQTQARIVATATIRNHKIYYISGTKKQLEEKKIIDRAGGLMGIGKTIVLSEKLSNVDFTTADYTKLTSLPLDAKDVTIVTKHPSDSYLLEKSDGRYRELRITDPEKFWSISRYLVISTK